MRRHLRRWGDIFGGEATFREPHLNMCNKLAYTHMHAPLLTRICTHPCLHAYARTPAYTHTHAPLLTRICTHPCLHAYWRTPAYTHMHAPLLTRICTHPCLHAYACIHAYTHMHAPLLSRICKHPCLHAYACTLAFHADIFKQNAAQIQFKIFTIRYIVDTIRYVLFTNAKKNIKPIYRRKRSEINTGLIFLNTLDYYMHEYIIISFQ